MSIIKPGQIHTFPSSLQKIAVVLIKASFGGYAVWQIREKFP